MRYAGRIFVSLCLCPEQVQGQVTLLQTTHTQDMDFLTPPFWSALQSQRKSSLLWWTLLTKREHLCTLAISICIQLQCWLWTVFVSGAARPFLFLAAKSRCCALISLDSIPPTLIQQHIPIHSIKLNSPLQKSHTHTHTQTHLHTCMNISSSSLAFINPDKTNLVKLRPILNCFYVRWKFSTHLILIYFLCCCSVTAPEGRGGVVKEVWTQKEKVGVVVEEKAEAVVIWHWAGCSFDMLEMRSWLYNSQKHCKSCVTLTPCTLSCSLVV